MVFRRSCTCCTPATAGSEAVARAEPPPPLALRGLRFAPAILLSSSMDTSESAELLSAAPLLRARERVDAVEPLPLLRALVARRSYRPYI